MNRRALAAMGAALGCLVVNLTACDSRPDRSATPTARPTVAPTAPATPSAAITAPPSPSTPSSPSPSPSPIRASSASPAPTRSSSPSPTATVALASGADVLAGTRCQIFPADNYWHADIRSLPVDPHSAQWLAAMGAATHHLHPDFGPSFGAQPVPYGIPVTVVPAGHDRVSVHFDYADESDQTPYPLGQDTAIEGGANADGDRHAILVTADTCELFETYDTRPTASGWSAGSGARWSLSSDALRPDGWTSADAAGLPILPGLLRYDEVAAGQVNHAIRFTTNETDASHLWPARHDASSRHDTSLPPMGARFRLKASFDIASYSPQAQVVLRAMQTYGLVLADNGSPWYFQGTADDAWPASLIAELKTIPASAFEAVDTSGLQRSPNSGAAR